MPEIGKGGEEFCADVAEKEIHRLHMKYEHKQVRKLLKKQPFKKREPA